MRTIFCAHRKINRATSRKLYARRPPDQLIFVNIMYILYTLRAVRNSLVVYTLWDPDGFSKRYSQFMRDLKEANKKEWVRWKVFGVTFYYSVSKNTWLKVRVEFAPMSVGFRIFYSSIKLIDYEYIIYLIYSLNTIFFTSISKGDKYNKYKESNHCAI